MDCVICVEPINLSTRALVVCDFCTFGCCRTCCETYILGQSQLAHCMSCKKEWTREVLLNKFTQKFVNTKYRTHRENYLFEIEQALLPATQPIVERNIKVAKIHKTISSIKDQIRALQHQCYIETASLNRLSHSQHEEKKQFVRKCPVDDCRGFLSPQWKCGLCSIWVCPHCNEIKGYEKNDDTHVCLKANVETVKLLNKDSKQCPTCTSMIFKTSGCDQMFCTMCHTAFSWKTGRLETNIHNPHYYEWLKTQNKDGIIARNPLDVRCGRVLDNYFIQKLNDMRVRVPPIRGEVARGPAVLGEVARRLFHIQQVNVDQFTRNARTNENLRIAYLLKTITFDEFKNRIQRQDKKNSKYHEIANLLMMFVTTATEILYRFFDDCKEHDLLRPFYRDEKILTELTDNYGVELNGLKFYVNECFSKIARVYNCKTYVVNDRYVLE
jgi:hypothetical protein